MYTFKITAEKNGCYHSGMVVSWDSISACLHYCKKGYEIVDVHKASDAEIEEARIKGMPITEVR